MQGPADGVNGALSVEEGQLPRLLHTVGLEHQCERLLHVPVLLTPSNISVLALVAAFASLPLPSSSLSPCHFRRHADLLTSLITALFLTVMLLVTILTTLSIIKS